MDKEKDIVVNLFLKHNILSYCLETPNHHTDNLICNLAKILQQPLSLNRQQLKVVKGTIPCFIKGDGQEVYVFRLAGTKIANIYPNGKIEINATIPAISKTLMSQTKDYKFDIRHTLIKSYILEDVKFKTDLHTHGNATLNPDVLIALGIKHQIRYPLYYIYKLNLILNEKQTEFIKQRRQEVIKQFGNDLDLKDKHVNRKINDMTFINFADLILNNLENANYNINKIRNSLVILKDSQAVFTNLEKLYLYRYVFTKGIKCDYTVPLNNFSKIPDIDVYKNLLKMLKDTNNKNYQNLTLFQDTLLWIGRSYQQQHINYIEISDTTLVKKDQSLINMLEQIHYILPLVEQETGVTIRYLAALRRIPLTIVKDNIASTNYLSENIEVLKLTARDPYVVGCDFVGEEINDISELKDVIREIVQKIASKDPHFTIRIHAGENDTLKHNMAKAINCVKDSLLPNQKYPPVRIGHGIYGADFKTKSGKETLKQIKENGVILEFQLTSNVRLNNLTILNNHPLRKYLKYGIKCVQGTDGCGLYGTDTIDEQLALQNLLNISNEEFIQMRSTEEEVLNNARSYFILKFNAFQDELNHYSVKDYYTNKLQQLNNSANIPTFKIKKVSSYQILKERVKELPWNKLPIILAGGSFTSNANIRTHQLEKDIIQQLLKKLDPDKFFFVIGHKLTAYEKYLVENNTQGFTIFAIVPSLLSKNDCQKLLNSPIDNFRISTESQEMGIYKSFNYEIFERRNSIVLAFEGNSALGNLVQEARNGKGKADIYLSTGCKTLKEKLISLRGYITSCTDSKSVIDKIIHKKYEIGTKLD
ncbi:MAG: adenosine deaminase [Erysipelotrichia bacterium]|nr:adenosine deaminase [Erysipelotrichia bacterium]